MIYHFDKLSKDIIEALKNTSQVKFELGQPGDCSTLDLTDSVEGVKMYMHWLLERDDIHPGVYLFFGNPLNPCVNVNCQLEVHNLFTTYSTLCKSSLALGTVLPPYIPQSYSFSGIYCFQSAVALHKAMVEIQTPSPARYAAMCPQLQEMVEGSMICSVSINYSGCIVTMNLIRRPRDIVTIDL